MAEQFLMAIDAGTGSVRAVLFDPDGNQVGCEQREWEHREDPRYPGSMDFDWVHNWELACACTNGVLQKTGIQPKQILAVSTTCMREGIVLYDKDGQEIWACANVDARSDDEVGKLIRMNPELEKEVYLQSGQTYALGALPRLLWVKDKMPEIYEKIAAVGMFNDWLIKKLNAKLEELGAPRNLIVTVQEPSIENTNIMMNHPLVRMLVATGGPGIVKAVMSTGKKAIGAGAGNPPVVVDETADIEKAAVDIVNGCSFDHNLPCIAEKEVIAVDQIADYLIFNMKNNGAYEVKDPAVIEQLVELVTNDRKKPNVNFVGKSAQYILDKVGITVGPEVKCIIMEAPKDHPFVQIELMMPILPIVRVPNVDDAIEFAVEVEHGNRHTAMMHSRNVEKLTKMAKEIETTIFVKNGPSYAGIGVGGMGYTTFTIAGPTGEGLTSAKSFCRKRRCVLQDGLHIRMK